MNGINSFKGLPLHFRPDGARYEGDWADDKDGVEEIGNQRNHRQNLTTWIDNRSYAVAPH